jgi:hypothetical protein
MLRNVFQALQNHVLQSSDKEYIDLIASKVKAMKTEVANLETAEELNAKIESLTEDDFGDFKSDLKLVKTARITELTQFENRQYRGRGRTVWSGFLGECLKTCKIEMGYSVEEIVKEIPDFFEGYIPVLIAEYGTSHIEMSIVRDSITFGQPHYYCGGWRKSES